MAEQDKGDDSDLKNTIVERSRALQRNEKKDG